MSWTRLDDAMGEHRKSRRVIRDAGLGAFGLHTLGILHSSRYLTDGFVEDAYVEEVYDLSRARPRTRETILAALQRHNLWVPAHGGWQIHDFLDHNPPRSQVESERERQRKAKSDAGKKGAAARWGNGSVPSAGDGRAMAAAIDVPCAGNGPVPPPSLTPLNPPSGGTRKRDREKKAEWIASLAAELYPDSSESARFVIGMALGAGVTTVGGLQAFVAERYPEVAKGAAA